MAQLCHHVKDEHKMQDATISKHAFSDYEQVNTYISIFFVYLLCCYVNLDRTVGTVALNSECRSTDHFTDTVIRAKGNPS